MVGVDERVCLDYEPVTTQSVSCHDQGSSTEREACIKRLMLCQSGLEEIEQIHREAHHGLAEKESSALVVGRGKETRVQSLFITEWSHG